MLNKSFSWLLLMSLTANLPMHADTLESFRSAPDRRPGIRQSFGVRSVYALDEQTVLLTLGLSHTEAAKNPNAYRILSEDDSAYAYDRFVRPTAVDVRDELEAEGISGIAAPRFNRRVVRLTLPTPMKPGATYHVIAQGVNSDMITAARTAATLVYQGPATSADRDQRIDQAVIGLRAMEPVGNGIIMVEFGPGYAPDAGKAAEAWRITVNDAPATVQAMGRITRVDTYLPSGWPFMAVPCHEIFLDLGTPLTDGDVVRLEVAPSVTAGWREADLTFHDRSTISPSIKVNQTGYLEGPEIKRAYLGRWMGSFPELVASRKTTSGSSMLEQFQTAVTALEGTAPSTMEATGGPALWFDEAPSFTLRNAATHDAVFTGRVQLVHRSGDLNEGYFAIDHSGENVYVLDFTAFTGTGTFYLAVPSVGRSVDFRIAGDAYAEAFRVASYGIFAQRCGMELAPPYSTWRRIACHHHGVIPTTLNRREGERTAHEQIANRVDYRLADNATHPEILRNLNRDPALTAYWPFEGNLADASGQAHHLHPLCPAPAYEDAPALKPGNNRALGPTRDSQTNGAALEGLNLDVASGLSLAAWIRFPGGIQFGGVILGQPGLNVHEERIQVFAGWGVIRAVLGKGGTVLDVGRLSDGEWHHIAVIAEPQTSTSTPARALFYVDGELRASGQVGTTTPTATLKPFMVGNLTGEDATGKYIDEVRVFRRALTATEVSGMARPWGREVLAIQTCGGHHDAGDYNPRSHIEVAQILMNAYEMAPRKFFDGQLNLPENGNGVPDVLDEAMWSMRIWLDLQDEDGGVRGGTESDGDPNFIQTVDLDRLGDFAFAKDPGASHEFAGVMAQAARIWRNLGRNEQAADFLNRARRAYAWAEEHPLDDAKSPGEYARYYLSSKAYAAAQLLHTTGESAYQVAFASSCVWSINPEAELARHNLYDQRLAAWAYATCEAPSADPVLRETVRKAIIAEADSFITNAMTMAYRFIRHPQAPVSWGTGAYQNFLDSTIWAWHLTGDARYKQWMIHTCDNTLGANPLSRSYITGLGERSVRAPLHNSRYNPTGEVVMGMQVQGPDQNGPGYRVQEIAYPKLRSDFAVLHTFVDAHFAIAMNEGTVVPQVRTMAAFGLLLPDR